MENVLGNGRLSICIISAHGCTLYTVVDTNTSQKKGYWFRAKTYGYGWYPASWQGALVLALYVLVGIKSVFLITAPTHAGGETLLLGIGIVILATAILLIICFRKGEPAKWRWGNKDT